MCACMVTVNEKWCDHNIINKGMICNYLSLSPFPQNSDISLASFTTEISERKHILKRRTPPSTEHLNLQMGDRKVCEENATSLVGVQSNQMEK